MSSLHKKLKFKIQTILSCLWY